MGAIDSAIATGMGLVTANWNDKRQLKQQEKLQNIQIKGQKEIGEFNQALALETWDKTNYDAQRKQMEKAGLNVGLMYGGAGSGGTTQGGQAGGIQGGQAPAGGGEIGMGIQQAMAMEMQKAQIENIKAQTNNTDVDTAKKAGVETDEIKSRIPTYAKEIEKTDAEIEAIAESIGKTKQEVKNLIEENNRIKATTQNINTNTKSTEQDIIGKKIENKYKDAKESSQLNKIITEIRNIQQNANATERKIQQEAKMHEINAAIKRKEITEEQGNELINWIMKIF